MRLFQFSQMKIWNKLRTADVNYTFLYVIEVFFLSFHILSSNLLTTGLHSYGYVYKLDKVVCCYFCIENTLLCTTLESSDNTYRTIAIL